MNILKENNGLSTRFELVNGSFRLMSGENKVDDNMSMFLNFIGWFRFFKQDYSLNIHRFYQSNTNNLFKYKNILRLSVSQLGVKHIPFATINAVDIPIDYNDRKRAGLYISYKYNLKDVDNSSNNVIRRILV